MAIVNVSLDTSSRQVVITVNGIMVPFDECCIEKYTFDGEEVVRFSYTVESVNSSGMKERRQFYLPSPEELASVAADQLKENGLASKVLYDDAKVRADIIDFLKSDRTTE